MFINKLHLRAFGKFNYKGIYLGKRLNIIYGENEAGKSTIHNFIEAILYGFENNEYGLTLYNKFKPWNSSQYKGSMSIDDSEGKKHLISRDFLLGTTQVFKGETENNKNPVMKEQDIECPGEHFLHMSKVSFRNTISIRQLGNKTEKELSNELKNKIINLSKSRDENISIERILSSLNDIREEAGSEDNPKTLLGQYSLRLKELEEAKENTINFRRQVMFLAMERKKLNNKILELDMRIANLKKEITDYELSLDKDIFLKAEPVKAELEEIIKELLKFKEENIRNFSKADYEEAVKANVSLNRMLNDRHNLQLKKDKTEEEIIALENNIANKIKDDFDIDKFNSDYNLYLLNKKSINEIKLSIETVKNSIKEVNIEGIDGFINTFNKVKENNEQIELLKLLADNKNYDLMKSYKKSQSIKWFFLSLLGLIFIAAAGAAGYGAYYLNMLEYYSGLALIIPGLISFVSAGKRRKLAINAKHEMDSIECENADNFVRTNNLISEAEELIKETGCSDFEEFKNVYENKSNQKNVIQEKLKILDHENERLNKLEESCNDLEKILTENITLFNSDEINEENINLANEIFSTKDFVKESIRKNKLILDETIEKLAKIDKETAFEEKRLSMILQSNDMANMTEFEEAVIYSDNFNELKSRKEYCENILKTILGKWNYETLKERTRNVSSYEVKELDKQEYQLKIFRMNEGKNILCNSIHNIDLEIDEIESSVRGLAELEEEIEFYKDKKSAFKERIKVAEIAAEKILEISDSIKGDFMPLLRKSISDNFAYLTNGRYKEVLIDQDMNILVISEDNKEKYINIENLSGGTLDQLYLSLRLGLSNILSGNQNIPIILDDSFVQYDSNRLKKSLEMLSRESERRQVILFTCQDREIEYAKQMNIKFNYIKL